MGRSRASDCCESVGRRLSISWRVSDCSCLCVASVLAVCRRGRKCRGPLHWLKVKQKDSRKEARGFYRE